jgi:archaeal flagellar protein FlaI
MLFKKKDEKKDASAPASASAPRAMGNKNVSVVERIRGLRGALWRVQTKAAVQQDNFLISEPKYLVILQKSADPSQIDVRYPLLEPYAYAKIFWDPKKKELVYNVMEPKIGKDDGEIFSKVMKGLMEIVDVELSTIKNSEAAISYMESYIKKVVSEYGLSLTRGQYVKLLYYVYRDFVGLNEIEPLMHDSYIEDIGCDGTGVPLYIVHKKFGSIRTNISFNELEKLNNFVVKLSERCGRYISYAEPLLDGTLPDGSRVQASLAGDVTTRGPSFSIRRFSEEPFSPVDMMEMGTADSQLLAFLWLSIEYGASILICGGVATGKTSMLNTLSLFIPQEAKIISIEDTRELQLPHENWIPSVARIGFGGQTESGKYGEVTMFDLLKESFRQNPDYVIVGEVRGAEAYVMFQGMAAGHPSIGTMHAGKVEDVVHRLETPPIELSPSLIETLDMIIFMVHAREVNKSARRVKEISEIESIDSTTGAASVNKVFAWMPSSDTFQFNESVVMLQKIPRQREFR